ncbi:tRNA-splicing endonuclease subunit Sen34 [Operophtera brumata]|uniref:tRNA-splicing endonuclease subunit SEN34 n=1 Tax=Operophtera brumata TaxID=104452 RepID=A0A0L7LV47_OPEBR|nr:tRNA-splicing endonuclease subunit Sen34 [Operophtera brumata]
MALMPEEAALLVAKSLCALYELPNLAKIPSEVQKKHVKELEQQILEEQTETLKKRKIEQMMQKIDIILPGLSPAHALVHIPTEDFLDTDPGVQTGDNAIKYAVFTDLWERGYHITSGSKFGCHYLVYPGDPVKFHATYMVRCVKKEKLFNPTAIVAFGRLAVGVNKLAVLAYLNSREKVEYQTLQWHDSIH